MELNRAFENFRIPVDSIWLDIPYAQKNSKYFVFDPEKFPLNEVE